MFSAITVAALAWFATRACSPSTYRGSAGFTSEAGSMPNSSAMMFIVSRLPSGVCNERDSVYQYCSVDESERHRRGPRYSVASSS